MLCSAVAAADNAGQANYAAGGFYQDARSSQEEAADHIGLTIAEKIADIFMIPLDEVGLANKPALYGIDSLIAVELRNMLAQQAAAEGVHL